MSIEKTQYIAVELPFEHYRLCMNCGKDGRSPRWLVENFCWFLGDSMPKGTLRHEHGIVKLDETLGPSVGLGSTSVDLSLTRQFLLEFVHKGGILGEICSTGLYI
jgi:hypothetical protein